MAFAVSGDRAAAEDDLQNAFAKVYAHWARVRRAGLGPLVTRNGDPEFIGVDM